MKSVVQPSLAPLLRLIQQLRESWRRFLGATPTRILLLYALILLGTVAIAIPIFRALLFLSVDERVRADLREELEEFETTYQIWDAEALETDTALVNFVDDFLNSKVPEDDNFHIVILNGQFYRSNPVSLPAIIQPGSALMQQWTSLSDVTEAVVPINDPQIGSVLFKTYVLETNRIPRGLFVVAHVSAGERAEALASVSVFAQVAIGVAIISFLLAWMASRQLLQPVQQLATTARHIRESDLSHRLEVKGSGDLAELAATFNAMMDRVQSAFDSQRNFINDAGHELRTPLTIIQGHLELMGEDPQEQQETLALVMDELERMGRFVNDLILLAKAERADFLRLETINLASLTEDIFSKTIVLAERQWRLGQLGAGRFVGDRQRITGAIINLAQNATQHTQTADTIELGSVISEQTVRFWIRDTGEGISPADQARIFDRFARAANSYRRSEGAGLGLAIVKAIADAHSGHVEVSSQMGIGSTFTLILPRSPTAQLPLPPSSAPL